MYFIENVNKTCIKRISRCERINSVKWILERSSNLLTCITRSIKRRPRPNINDFHLFAGLLIRFYHSRDPRSSSKYLNISLFFWYYWHRKLISYSTEGLRVLKENDIPQPRPEKVHPVLSGYVKLTNFSWSLEDENGSVYSLNNEYRTWPLYDSRVIERDPVIKLLEFKSLVQVLPRKLSRDQ